MRKKIPSREQRRRFIEEHLGKEPERGTDLTQNSDYGSVLNVYSERFGRPDSLKFLFAWLAEQGATERERLRKAKKVKDNAFSLTLGWVARLRSLECKLPESSLEWFERTLNDTLKKHRSKPQPKAKAEAPKERPSYIPFLESKLDEFFLGGFESEFEFDDWARSGTLGPTAMKEVIEFYQPLLDELALYDSDPQVKEGYSHLTKKQRLAYVAFVESFVDGATAVLENRKRQRKPRKKKALPADKLVAGVKYRKEDKELNIVSLPPEKLVGASMVLLYDAPARQLIWFTAEKDTTISVKGTTLLNVARDKAVMKKIRKPAEIIPAFAKAGKRELGKLFAAIKTKEQKPNGSRVNHKCLILNVWS